MRIALGLPSRVVDASGEMMLDWATHADRGPFSSVVVTDRVVSQALEPLAVLAMAAGATQRIRLMTSVVIGPTSPRPSGPEMLIGGYVPAIVERIAKWGDGYMAPGGGEPQAMLNMWQQILQAWQDNGRAGKPRWVGASYFALGPNALDHATRYINHNYGYNPELAAKRLRTLPASRDAVEESIKRQADMGVDEFILRPCAEDLDQMERLAEVAARFS